MQLPQACGFEVCLCQQCGLVYEANGYIIIQVTKNFDYDIAIEQINKDGLEFWLRHLQEKDGSHQRLNKNLLKFTLILKMAKQRYIDTRFWHDTFIREKLNPLDRYLFLYFLTNDKTNNISGIYELPISIIASETGMTKELIPKAVKRFVGENTLH